MDIDRAVFSRIKEVLKDNPRGMNVTEIAREIKMNRLSVAKYLEILVVSGHIDVKAFGPAKVYYISSRLPISAMLSLSSDFIIILDKDLNIIHMNDQFLSFSGIRREDILYKKIENFSFPLEFSPSIMPNVVEALNGKELVAEACLKKNGRQLYFNIKFIPLVMDDGQKGVTILFENITDRKRIELAIQESERKLRSVIEQSMDSIVITDEQGVIVEFNQGAEGITGIERIKAIGMNIWDIQFSVSTHDRNDRVFYEEIKSLLQKFLKSGKSPRANKYIEQEIIRLDGSRRTIQSNTFPIKTEKGYMLCDITRDMTDRKRTELELMDSEERFRAIFEQAAVGIAYVDSANRYISTNKRFCDIIGYSQGELDGLTYADITYPDDIGIAEERLGQIKAGSLESYAREKRFVRKDGSIIWANVTVSSLRLHEPNTYHLVVIEDITERKQLESSLRLAGFALDSAADLVALIKPDGKLYYVNDSACKSLGYTREELLRMSVHDVDNSFTEERWAESWSLLKTEDHVGHIESVYRAKDGSIIPVEIVGRFIEFDGKEFVCASARNISERKRVEDALRKSHEALERRVEERTLQLKQANEALQAEISKQVQIEYALRASEQKYRSIVENISDGVWELDSRLAFTYISPRVFNMVGLMPEDVLGKTPFAMMGPEEADRAKGPLFKVAMEKRPFSLFECKLLHKGGWTIDVEISGDPIFASDGTFSGYRGITRDVTQRNRDKEELSAANRSLRLLSDCNRALIQSTDERSLLADICHILVETGGYRLAWVGYKELDAEKSIRPVAHAGNDTGYLDAIKISWSDERIGGMGPGGMAIRNCSPFILRWDGLDGQFVWWRKEALERGIASIIGLPLMENGQAFGVLLIYSDQMDAFNDTEVELLKELTDNMSFGVVAIRARLSR